MEIPGVDPAGHGDEIVVGVDGSAESGRALRWAVGEARDRGLRVCAVLVWDPVFLAASPMPSITSLRRLHEEEQRSLDRAVDEVLPEAAGVALTRELRRQRPADGLVDRSAGATMLVLGSHGRGRVGGALLGSVAAGCLRRARCPVLLVGPAAVVPDPLPDRRPGTVPAPGRTPVSSS